MTRKEVTLWVQSGLIVIIIAVNLVLIAINQRG